VYGARDTPRQRLTEEVGDLVRGLAAVNERLGQAFAARHGLHPTDLAALLAIMRAEGAGQPITAGELMGVLGLTSGAVTGVIDRLERVGHIRRRRDDRDRRKVHLHYGDEGMRIAGAFFGPVGAMSDQVMDEFDDAELATVHRFLTRMTAVTVQALDATQRGD
jgi:DNA-binding MarR family transcriptional regulator